MKLSKLLVLAVPWIFGPHAYAGNPIQMGYFGAGSSSMHRLESDLFEESSSLRYNIEVGVYTTRRLVTQLNWDLEFFKAKTQSFSVGLKYLLKDNQNLLPVILAQFHYVIVPQGAPGYRVASGVEWNLVKLTGLDNLRLHGNVGVEHVFYNEGAQDFLFSPRLLLAWHF